MKKDLFRSRKLRAIAVMVAAALPLVMVASASAATSNTTTVFATVQGTSVLGIPVPVLGTQGYDITLPVRDDAVPGEALLLNAIDFTVTSEVTVGDVQVLNLYVDPHATT